MKIMFESTDEIVVQCMYIETFAVMLIQFPPFIRLQFQKRSHNCPNLIEMKRKLCVIPNKRNTQQWNII